MDFVTWGRGPKTLIEIQGGPGSAVPKGLQLRMARRRFDPYLGAGFTVWIVTRRRNMPPGHTIADMADDFARMIAEEFGGRVDVVLGVSYGGMIAQYLPALHPGSVEKVVLVAAAAEVSAWGKALDSRLAAALARGDPTGAGAALTEVLLAGEHTRWLRRLAAPLIGRMYAAGDYLPDDLLVEARAEEAFDARAVLPRIQSPVLLICGDQDRFFPKRVVEETAALIPDCTLIWYEGRGHAGTAASRHVPRDVLAFVHPQ
jgi:pimeloyl-ACP methyl ester carboxylesterase